MNLRKDDGQTIIEAVVSLAAIGIIVGAIAIVILNALNNSEFVKNQNLANKYAQQAMESVRGIHANNIESFQALSGVYSLGDDDNELMPGESFTVNVEDSHIRNIYFTDDEEPCLAADGSSINLKKVTVVVAWSGGRCSSEDRFCHNTTLVSCIPYEASPNVFP